MGDKFKDNIDTGLTQTFDTIVPDVIKEEDTKINKSSDYSENTATIVSNESATITPEELDTTLERNSKPASESNENNLFKADESTSVGKADESPIEAPTKAVESPSEAEQPNHAKDVKVENTFASINTKEASEANPSPSTEVEVEEDVSAASVVPVEKASVSSPPKKNVNVDPIENAATTEEADKVDETQIEDSKPVEIIASENPLKEEVASVEETREDSTTATPSPELSDHNLITTNSTDVDTEKEKDIRTNDDKKNLKEDSSSNDKSESTSKSINDGALNKEDKAEAKNNSADLKANTSQKTNSAKEPKKNIAASASRIKPPSSINKTHASTRGSVPTSVPTRQASITASKPSKAGATRIARLSPSATLNTQTATADKKKRISPPQDNAVPSVAKKTVTRVSKNLPRVALMATQKPPKTSEGSEDEGVEKKPKKRTSSTRSFISRLTTPTVASANKKTDFDTPAVSSTTKTAKRSSLPSKRSSTVRPMSLSAKVSNLKTWLLL